MPENIKAKTFLAFTFIFKKATLLCPLRKGHHQHSSTESHTVLPDENLSLRTQSSSKHLLRTHSMPGSLLSEEDTPCINWKWKGLNQVGLFATPWTIYSPWSSPGQNTGVDTLSLLKEIFPTQGLNPGLPHCRWILYELSHKGSPGIQEWVAYPFSSGSSQPRNRTRVSCRQILY